MQLSIDWRLAGLERQKYCLIHAVVHDDGNVWQF